MARSLRGSAHADFHAGDWAAARALIERSLAVSEAADDRPGLAWSVNDLADVARRDRESERGEAGWRDALGRFEQLGVGFGVYRVHLSMGILGLRREDWAAARQGLRLGRAGARLRALRLPRFGSAPGGSQSRRSPAAGLGGGRAVRGSIHLGGHLRSLQP